MLLLMPVMRYADLMNASPTIQTAIFQIVTDAIEAGTAPVAPCTVAEAAHALEVAVAVHYRAAKDAGNTSIIRDDGHDRSLQVCCGHMEASVCKVH